MVVLRRSSRRGVTRAPSSARRASAPENTAPSSPVAPIAAVSPPIADLPIDSIHSPYHLTNGDNSGLSIISESLDGTNYENWSIAMNKLAFIDGSIERPSESHQHFRIWSRCNSMVKSWILNTVSKQIYKSILRFNDAVEIWNDLSTRFHITNIPRSYHLSQQIWSLQQGSMDLATYHTTLKTLWDELDGANCVSTCRTCDCCKATATQLNHAKVIKFLAGLNESYSVIRSQIIMKKHIPELSEIYNLLDQDFNQRTISPITNTTSFQISASSPPLLNATQASVPGKQNRLVCTHCGYNGHTVDTCYKIHGYPVGFKHKTRQQADKTSKQSNHPKPVVAQVEFVDSVTNVVNNLTKDQIEGVIAYFNSQLKPQPAQVNYMASSSGGTITALPGMAFSSSTLCFVGMLRATSNALSTQTWIIDSGATHHVAHNKDLFFDFSASISTSVTLPTGLGVQIAGIGSIRLSDSLTLKNVLYLPDFRLNLLSVSQLTKDLGFRVIFDPATCMIHDPTRGLMIGKGEQICNLYVLDTVNMVVSSLLQQPFASCSSVVVDVALWHKRLGHPSMSKTDSIIDVLGFKQLNKEPFHCSICPLAKQKRLPFQSKNNMSQQAFDLLHIDTWGPFSISTAEGYRYFLTIVDDHTRVTWIYLMHTKDEVLTVFPDFIQMIETQYQGVIKAVRSDNAPELKFVNLFKKKGIVSFHSCPETPEQNSVVERKHQHILNVARALMFQSNVPKEFWGDCVLTAVFIINRLPTPFLNDRSPYELLTSKKADYNSLKVFGCLAYFSTSTKNRNKFQPRAKPCLFLGYPAGYKGYKLLDLESNNVHISRNVVFHESIFPCAKNTTETYEDIFSSSLETDTSDPIVEVTDDISSSSDSPSTPSIGPDSATFVSKDEGKRISKLPAHLKDYYCIVAECDTEIPYPLSAYMSFESLSEDYKAYICAVAHYPEPTSFTQAKKFDEWLTAMNEELIALESTDTWSICSLPPGKHAIGCRWVYKIKINPDGTIERYKARLVAKGYTQKEGEDFADTFSPVAKMTTVKTLLAVSAAKNWSLTQLDISNAFLNGDLDEEIYMTLPPGYTPKNGETLPPNAVCKLQKSLYGLKQASRQWFLKLSGTLLQLGFTKSNSDHSLFIRNVHGIYTAVLVYVDDIIIASNNDEDVTQLKIDLNDAFKLRDLGILKYFLGLEIARSTKGISVCQRKYTLGLLEDTGLLACKLSPIPMDPHVKLCLDSKEPLLDDQAAYRRLVGRMMYLTITRPDITFAVNKLCQFTSTPKASHLQAAMRVLRYLKGSIGLGLFYSAESTLVLQAFTDADWASCLDSRRSTSGYCMFLGNALISWKSKKQQTVSHSSAESEYRAMEFGSREVVWLRNLLAELQSEQHGPVAFFCDSTAAIHIATNSVFHERTKHIELDCHQVRERVVRGFIKLLHVRTTNQLADIFTKALFSPLFYSLVGKMALKSIYLPF